MGFSLQHSSNVPLVLNQTTCHISPQFHVVFDDGFSTVNSIAPSDTLPPFWTHIGLDDIAYDEHVHRIPLDSSFQPQLADEWLSPCELEE